MGFGRRFSTINAASGRRSTASLRMTTTSTEALKSFAAAQTVIVGFAFTCGTLTSGSNLVELRESAITHVQVFVGTDGRLSVYRGVTLLATSVLAIATGTYYYLELKAKIDNTTGTYEIRINGVNWLSATGQDTQNAGTAVVNTLVVSSPSGTTDIDDLYLCDTSGSAPNNDFLGDCRIDCQFPNADGTYSDFTCSTGSSHYVLVDETAPNTSDYNESSTVGHIDSYNFTDLTAVTGTIYGVQVCPAILKDDAGARSAGAFCRSSSTDSAATGVALTTGQLYYPAVYALDPATSAAWTEAGVNAAQFGVKVTA